MRKFNQSQFDRDFNRVRRFHKIFMSFVLGFIALMFIGTFTVLGLIVFNFGDIIAWIERLFGM